MHRRLTSTFLLTAAAFAGFAGSAVAGTPDPATIAALEHEAARGRIDRALVADLRDGPATAIMTIEPGELIRRAGRGLPGGHSRDERLAAWLRPRLADEKDDALARAGSAVEVERELPNLPAAVVELETADAALDVLHDPQVDGLRENRTMRLDTAQSMPVIKQPSVAAAGRTGAGTYTLILDTGIKAGNTPFGCVVGSAGCRVASSWDAAPNDGYDDDDGHGTNVAAIAASVAPGTKILAVDVFQRDANGKLGASVGNVLRGINWAIDLKRGGYNITSLNMSIGSPVHYTSACTTSGYATTFATARALGILPVVSAGNAGTVSGQFRNGVAFPACTPGAVSVGATYDGNNGALGFRNCTDATTFLDKITCFSQRGPTLSMYAPGAMITAGGYRMAGTSQAAPHVAGAASVLAAARPSATLAQIQDALVNSGPAIVDAASGTTRRRLDLGAAVARLTGGSSSGQAPVMTSRPLHTISGPLGASTVPVTFSYAGSDDVAVTRYQAFVRVNGGAWQAVTLAAPTTRSFSLSVTPGRSYQVAVRAVDGSGNASAWAYGDTFVAGVSNENAAGIRYTTGWRLAAATGALGGQLAVTSTAGAQVTFSFTGREVAWFGARATNRGKAHVWADGVYVGVVDQYATATQWRAKVFGHRFAATGAHTLTIRNIATAGRPSIDVDAFAVVR